MRQIGVSLTLGLVGVFALIVLLGWMDPGARELRDVRSELAIEQALVLAPLVVDVKRALLISLALAGISGSVWTLARAAVRVLTVRHELRRSWIHSWLVEPVDHGALYPSIVGPDGAGHIRMLPPGNEPGAQRVAALTTGLSPDAGAQRLAALRTGLPDAARLQGAAVRQILRGDDPNAMLPEPGPLVEVEPAQRALTVDPVERPHWLVVGQTGSGKSTATRFIMTELAGKHRVEFVVCEPGGIDWNASASAVSQRGIAGAISAVYGEFERRQEVLRRADVAHISQLTGERLPYVYLVVEEMEAVLDDLKVMDRGLMNETLINLRQIARMGRKPGIGLIAVTQAARTDVFDSHVRTNLANVLLFRNGQGTAEMFRVGQQVVLPSLPTGEAFSLAHGHRLRFPMVPRPDVPMSSLYHEVDGAPAGTITTTYRMTGEPVAEPAIEAVATVALPKRMPTAEEAVAMREHYRRVGSKSAVCRKFYGYKDGDVWAWVEQALEGAL